MEQLIEVVRLRPILYDTTHDEYMRTKLKDELTVAKAQRVPSRGFMKTTEKKWNNQTMDISKTDGVLETIYEKQKTSFGCSDSSILEKSHLEQDNITISVDQLSIESNCGEIEHSTETTHSEQRVQNIDDLHCDLITHSQNEACLSNDPLYLFFMFMYNTTKNLPVKYQKQVKGNFLKQYHTPKMMLSMISRLTFLHQTPVPNVVFSPQNSASSRLTKTTKRTYTEHREIILSGTTY
nr:unnamed protein product [Callosobruchus chinensis]